MLVQKPLYKPQSVNTVATYPSDSVLTWNSEDKNSEPFALKSALVPCRLKQLSKKSKNPPSFLPKYVNYRRAIYTEVSSSCHKLSLPSSPIRENLGLKISNNSFRMLSLSNSKSRRAFNFYWFPSHTKYWNYWKGSVRLDFIIIVFTIVFTSRYFKLSVKLFFFHLYPLQ